MPAKKSGSSAVDSDIASLLLWERSSSRMWEGGQVIAGAALGPYQFGVRHHKVKKDVWGGEGERES
jgi:hypothetical protein